MFKWLKKLFVKEVIKVEHPMKYGVPLRPGDTINIRMNINTFCDGKSTTIKNNGKNTVYICTHKED